MTRFIFTQDSLGKQFSDLSTLNTDEQAIVHYMYNLGDKMTTVKAIGLSGRSRKFIVKTMRNLQELGIVDWYGANKDDRNQYYTLARK
ncbi:hypothetical protein ACVRXX_01985 [Streptococcus plurextorum]